MRTRAALSFVPLLLLAAPDARSQSDERAAQEAQELAKLQPAIDEAIARGAEYLISEQLLDGTWDFATAMYPSGQTALCVYTLLEAEVPRGHAAVQQGFAAMLARPARETYSAACQLLALESSGELAHRRAVQAIADELVSWQVEGLWSYPLRPGPKASWERERGDVDLSNTQLAMLGLRAAAMSGAEVPELVYREALAALPAFQGWTRAAKGGERSSTGSTGFRYELEYRFPPTGSMTAGGVGCLKIALDALGERAQGKVRREAEQQMQAGLGWLRDHWSVVTNPVEGGELGGGAGPGESWHLYYLYALERLGAFFDAERIAEHPWYLEGARHLVATQTEKGYWGERHAEESVSGIANRDLPDTCFAVLFLARASHGGSTLSGPSDAPVIAMEETGSDVRFRAIPGNPLTIWVTGFAPRVLDLYGDGGRKLRVARVEYLVDGEVAHALDGDPRRAWKPEERFEHRLWFERIGPRELRVRVGLVEPASERGAFEPEIWLESFPVALEVEQVLEPWMVELAELPRRNLVPESRAKVTASSSEDDSSGATRAIDGRFATRWLCGPADEAPWLRLELGRPQTADTLLLCQAARRAAEAEFLARITRVQVRVNGAETPGEHELAANPLHPASIPLPTTEPVRSLEIRVTGVDRGESAYARVGFTELSLELRAPVRDE